MQEGKGLYLNRGKREREKNFYQAANIYKTGGKYQAKRYSFLGCHTITVSETLSFQARKSCSFSLRHEVLLLTCHSSACVDRKGPKGFQFSRLLSHEVFQSSSEGSNVEVVKKQVFFKESAILPVRHKVSDTFSERESLCLRLPLIKTIHFSAQMFTQTRNNRKTTM